MDVGSPGLRAQAPLYRATLAIYLIGSAEKGTKINAKSWQKRQVENRLILGQPPALLSLSETGFTNHICQVSHALTADHHHVLGLYRDEIDLNPVFEKGTNFFSIFCIDSDRSGLQNLGDYMKFEGMLRDLELGFDINAFLRKNAPTAHMFEEKGYHINLAARNRRAVYCRVQVALLCHNGRVQEAKSEHTLPSWFASIPPAELAHPERLVKIVKINSSSLHLEPIGRLLLQLGTSPPPGPAAQGEAQHVCLLANLQSFPTLPPPLPPFPPCPPNAHAPIACAPHPHAECRSRT